MPTYNVFGNAVPTAPNETDADGSYGTVIDIQAGVTGTVTHARWRFPDTLPSSPVTWHLYDLTNSVALAEHTFTAPVAGQWVQEALNGAGIEGPVQITGPRRVIAWVGTPDRYVATGGFFTGHAETNGPLTAPATETVANGRFGGDPASVPSGTFNGGAYFPDLVFQVPDPINTGEADFPFVVTIEAIGAATGGGQGRAAFTLGLTLAGQGQAVEPAADVRCGWEGIDLGALGACTDWAQRPVAARNAALSLAVDYLWARTGRRFGVCPVTIEPRQGPNGAAPLYEAFPVLPGSAVSGEWPVGPFLFAGRWFNAGCGIACCGSRGCAVVLPGPVADVREVTVDGEAVPESAYRVIASGGAYLLERLDGECWSCSGLSVTYGLGVPPPGSLVTAVALLACEYVKSLTGGECKLPARMTRLSRQGVDIEVDQVGGDTNSTGIREVDDVIAALNPSGRQSPPLLLSPDLPGTCDRVIVWGS